MGTGLGKSLDFITCSTFTAADDSTCVTHSSTWWSRSAGDESDDWFVVLVVLLDVFRRVFLHGSTDLSDEDDTLGLGVREEDLDDVNVLGSWEWVSSDTDGQGLSESSEGGLARVSKVNGTMNEGRRMRGQGTEEW